jgi:hypothetical protein
MGPFIASRGLEVVASFHRNFRNFLVCGRIGRSGAPPSRVCVPQYGILFAPFHSMVEPDQVHAPSDQPLTSVSRWHRRESLERWSNAPPNRYNSWFGEFYKKILESEQYGCPNQANFGYFEPNFSKTFWLFLVASLRLRQT